MTDEAVVQSNKPKMSALEQVRLRNAAEAHKEHKAIFIDPVTGEPQEGFKPWPQFRDEFLADWASNRRVVTEKEADDMFDRIAEESLTELEGTPAVDVNQVAEQVATAESDESVLPLSDTVIPVPGVPTNAAVELVSTPKRRGRPRKVVDNTPTAPAKRKSYYVPVSQRKTKAPVKRAAAKRKSVKKQTGAHARASVIVAWGQSRKWARKDIIERMMSRIDGLGAAYASTLYQKLAK